MIVHYVKTDRAGAIREHTEYFGVLSAEEVVILVEDAGGLVTGFCRDEAHQERFAHRRT